LTHHAKLLTTHIIIFHHPPQLQRGSRSTGRKNKAGAGRPTKKAKQVKSAVEKFQILKQKNPTMPEAELFSKFETVLECDGVENDDIVEIFLALSSSFDSKSTSAIKPMTEDLKTFVAENKDISKSYKKMTSSQLEAEIKIIGTVTGDGLLFDLTQTYEAEKKLLNLKKKLAQYYETNAVASTSPDMLQLTSFFETRAKKIQDARMAEFHRRKEGGETQEQLVGSDSEEEETTPTPHTDPIPAPVPKPAPASGGKGKK